MCQLPLDCIEYKIKEFRLKKYFHEIRGGAITQGQKWRAFHVYPFQTTKVKLLHLYSLKLAYYDQYLNITNACDSSQHSHIWENT
jgi:hypothetical protein